MIVVTEIPFQVQKSRLIEQIAQLLEEKKLPLLGDIRDESAETVRLVFEPKTRGVEPDVLMATLFRATQLETRFPLNMNVLTADRTPMVLGLKQVLRQWLDHREVVLRRRSEHRLAAIDRRIEILDGFLAVYLNIDEVIRIIRNEDEPKTSLIKTFELSDLQAEAVLNMRLRSLRKLEEIEIRKEHKLLSGERKNLHALLADIGKRWQKISAELETMRTKFGGGLLGTRRTRLAEAPTEVAIATEAFVEREPITVILSDKGWIRAMKGHLAPDADLKFKDGDKLRLMVTCETTDRLCLFATNGRAYTLKADELPRGRGDGQPVRLLGELTNEDDVTALFIWREAARYLVATNSGRGFIAKAEDLQAEKRTGKQVLNLKPGEEASFCIAVSGDHVATIGDNKKLLVFPLAQIPEMVRGAGVILQKFKDGGMRDVKMFVAADGLTWRLGEKTRTEPDLRPWLGERAGAGKLPPNGFPKSGKFG